MDQGVRRGVLTLRPGMAAARVAAAPRALRAGKAGFDDAADGYNRKQGSGGGGDVAEQVVGTEG